MKNLIQLIICLAVLISCTSTKNTSPQATAVKEEITSTNHINKPTMNLGAFSVSLSVKDLKVSKEFYENLGFEVLAGDFKMNYFIMKNGTTLIGIFHGMFENNILTFNPGWDENAKNTESFDDVRTIQKGLKEKGTAFMTEADEGTSGPASFMIQDPDGNVILVDQHR